MIGPKCLHDLIKEYGLSEDDLNQPMKLEHCDEVAIRVGRDWERLATAIGFEEFEVHDIQDSNHYREPKHQRIALFRKWKKRNGKEATYVKIVHGLEEIKNRELTEFVISSCQECMQKKSTHVDKSVKTGKRKQYHTNKSKFAIALALTLICTLLICALISLNLQTDRSSTLLRTSHIHEIAHNDSTAAMDLWSPKYQDGGNCSQRAGHDLPLLYGLFIGRENDISKVMDKAKNANILNINGAPGFGKSTLAIHVGYRLVENCTSVRYINMEDLSSRTLAEFTDEPERGYETKWKNGFESKEQTVTTLVKDTSSSLEHSTLLSESNTVDSGNLYTEKLMKWSQTINQTTFLIFDNVDVIYSSTFCTNIKFVDLITFLVENSKLHLHIIVVSQKQLLLTEHFDRWIVKELSQQVSIELLSKLAPGIAGSELTKIAELLQGCPLALKVIGSILHISGQDIIQELESELLQQPIDVLDQVSDHRQQFGHIMDLIFSKLKILACGYIVSLFPGSFSREAGIAILPSKECLEMFERHSLLDEYFLGYQHRYKMHRLIREYLRNKLDPMEEDLFQSGFSKHYIQFLLKYAAQSELNVIDKHILESESVNIQLLFEHILLSAPIRKFSTENFVLSAPITNISNEELEVLAFLVREGYIQVTRFQNTFKQFLIDLHNIQWRAYDDPNGKFTASIVKHFYLKCKCKDVTEYIQKCFTDDYACIDIFSCEVIKELQGMHSYSNLSQQELNLLHNIVTLECGGLHWTESLSASFMFTVLIYVLTLIFYDAIRSAISYSHKNKIPTVYRCGYETIVTIIVLIIFLIIFYCKFVLSLHKLFHIEATAKWMCRYAIITICIFDCLNFYRLNILYIFTKNLNSKQQLIIRGVVLIFSILIWSFSPNLCSRLPICQ